MVLENMTVEEAADVLRKFDLVYYSQLFNMWNGEGRAAANLDEETYYDILRRYKAYRRKVQAGRLARLKQNVSDVENI